MSTFDEYKDKEISHQTYSSWINGKSAKFNNDSFKTFMKSSQGEELRGKIEKFKNVGVLNIYHIVLINT
jgi:hypothetical protein